jgi:hypothetical protein
MVTLILPGFSSHNKEWLEATAQQINVDGEIRPIYWGHWTDPISKFDVKEKARLLDGVSGKRVVNIIAKSVGTLVAAYIIQKSPEKINKVILNGMCLNDLDEDDKEIVKNALKLISPTSIVCFQNENDLHGSVGKVKVFLSDISPDIKVVTKPGDTHEYPYQDEFRKFLLE